jgi:hypothetical protein
LEQLIDRYLVMGGNVFENGTEGANSSGRVIRHGNMVFAIFFGTESDMGTILADALITKLLEGFD